MAERENLNSQENIFMQDIMILRNDLVKYSEAVHARIKPYPGAWRDLRLLLHLVRKLQSILLDTIPDKKVAQLQTLALHGKFSIEMPGPVRIHRFVTVDEDHLGMLMQCAMTGECVMCVREGKEVKRCELRAALMATTPPKAIMHDHHVCGCEYQEIACALHRGENVSW